MAKLSEKLNNTLKDKKGNFAVIIGACILIMICTVIFIFCFETNRMMFTSTKVHSVISDGIVSAARNNLIESFPTIRQGNSGAYKYRGSGYRQIKDISGFEENVCSLYKLTKSSDSLARKINGSTIWKISDIRIEVKNANHDITSEYKIYYDLIIPHKFLWNDKTLILQNQIQTVHYKAKY